MFHRLMKNSEIYAFIHTLRSNIEENATLKCFDDKYINSGLISSKLSKSKEDRNESQHFKLIPNNYKQIPFLTNSYIYIHC